MSNITKFSFWKSPAFWSGVVTVFSALFAALAVQFPNATWIGTTVSVLSFISMTYFHVNDVNKAVAASLSANAPKHGQ